MNYIFSGGVYMSKKSDKRQKYEKNDEPHKNDKKNNLKYLIITVVFLSGISVFLMASNQGKILLSSVFDKKETTRDAAIPVNAQTEAPVILQSEKPLAAQPEKTTTVKKEDALPDKPAPTLPPKAETIQLPFSKLTKQAQFFSYKSKNNVSIRYFGLLDEKGSPHLAFDACDVCYGAKKGYMQQGDRAVCKNCGNAYPIQAIGTQNVQGGCWPSYLPIKIEGQQINIAINDLEKKEYMFN
jgi:uncharacterized membrane protein